MSTIHWRGDSAAVAQVTTATPANVEAGDVFTLTVNNKSVSYTAAAATVADVTAGLAAAWNNATAAELAEVTAVDDGSHVTLTADTPGVPFAVSGAAVNGGAADTQTLTVTTVVDSAGPEHWDTAENWDGGALPANGDDVYLEHSAASIRYGLDQSAVALASLHIGASFTGEIGLPRVNRAGAAEYVEYRGRDLKIGCDTLTVGLGEGEGSGRVQIDSGAVRVTLEVQQTGAAAEAPLPPLLWKGTHASNVVHVRDGHVGVALFGGEAASVVTLSQTGGRLEIGEGANVATASVGGSARLLTRGGITTLQQAGGRTVVAGEAAVSTINHTGGVIDFRSNGSVNNLNLSGGDCLVDYSHDGRGKTVGNCSLLRGEIYDPLRCVTFTNGIAPGGRIMALPIE